MLYEVAILEKPTKKEAEEGGSEKLILAPKAVVARDPQSAAISAVLDAQASMKDLDPPGWRSWFALLFLHTRRSNRGSKENSDSVEAHSQT